MDKATMEDVLETLLEERGVPRLTTRAWDACKQTMRQWIDNTLEEGLTECVRDVLLERWDELFPPTPVPVEPITLDLAHEGAVGDVRNFEIRTPREFPNINLVRVATITPLHEILNAVAVALQPYDATLDGDMLRFSGYHTAAAAAATAGEAATEFLDLEVVRPEPFDSEVEVRQGRVARGLEMAYVPNETPGVTETSSAEPPSSAAPPIDEDGGGGGESEDSNGGDFTEFLEIFRA